MNEEKKGSRTLFDVGVFEGSADPDSQVPLELPQKARDVDSTDDDGELSVDGDAASSQVHSLNVSSIERQGFDIGTLTRSPTSNELDEIVKAGHIPHPNQFPRDVTGKRFPTSVLSVKKQNGETSRRCWIVYSPTKQAIYCFPCRIFWHTIDNPAHMQSSFFSRDGWGTEKKWKKLWDRIPDHEKSDAHKNCYLLWRKLQRRLENDTGINVIIEENVSSEAEKWKKLLSRIIDVVIFLGQRGLAFHGSSLRIGDVDNGNFLGLLELLAHYDPTVEEHVTKVKVAQQKGERLQAHYLSPESQNEFISLCAARVRRCILDERELAKYYSIMVDATPDSSHIEQTTFILRFLTKANDSYVINERFLALNLTAKTTSEVNGAIKYVSSFTCLVMSSVWLKVLVAIDQRNQIIQARKATIDVEVSNLKSLLEDLKKLRENWPLILRGCKLVASAANLQNEFPSRRKSKRPADYAEIQVLTAESTGEDQCIESEEERTFKHNVFFVIVDCVIAGLTTRYVSANSINNLFCFLWQYLELSEDQILEACNVFGKKYANDVSKKDLKEEMLRLKAIHSANFGNSSLPPFELLSTIRKFRLEEIFPNVCIGLRMFCTLPVTVASAERSFSKLKLVNFLRSTMGQERLSDLAMLSIEAKIARCVGFQDIINDFATKKHGKLFVN